VQLSGSELPQAAAIGERKFRDALAPIPARMNSWLEWGLFASGGWIVAAAVIGLALGRVFELRGASDTRAVGPWAAGRAAPVGESPGDRPRVLIVDDDGPLRSLLRATLSPEDFDVRETGSAEQAREVIAFWRPRIVLLDVTLPGMDGLTSCAELAGSSVHRDASVILLTGEPISDTAARLAGAKAVVRKPFSPLELMTLLARLVGGEELAHSPALNEEEQLLVYARDLASIARAERHQRRLVQEAYRETAMALADAVDVRDRATGLHAQRVRRYALALTQAVDPALLDDPSLEYGFLLHDIGKIAITDQVLLKPGPLTVDERELLRAHPTIGVQILRNVVLLRGSGLDVVRYHHERWDGAGYPEGLSGEEIPLGARIFAVVDTLDAMTSDRPYRNALDWPEAVDEVLAQSGRQFDPAVVDVFAARQQELRTVYEDLSLVA
jgi:response regulator RpfG family c-di-GMP phosphodiesterase